MKVVAAILVADILPLSLGRYREEMEMGVGQSTHLEGDSGAIFVLNLG